MPRENLTDNRLKALKPAKPGERYVIMDAQVPSMGVRVTDKAPLNGSKLKAGQISFIYIARQAAGSQGARRIRHHVARCSPHQGEGMGRTHFAGH